MTLREELREAVKTIRVKPFPIADLIPLLNRAADLISGLEDLNKKQQVEIGCYKIELELHKAMIQDLENALKNAQTNPLQNKLDAIANKVVFGKAQEK